MNVYPIRTKRELELLHTARVTRCCILDMNDRLGGIVVPYGWRVYNFGKSGDLSWLLGALAVIHEDYPGEHLVWASPYVLFFDLVEPVDGLRVVEAAEGVLEPCEELAIMGEKWLENLPRLVNSVNRASGGRERLIFDLARLTWALGLHGDMLAVETYLRTFEPQWHRDGAQVPVDCNAIDCRTIGASDKLDPVTLAQRNMLRLLPPE